MGIKHRVAILLLAIAACLVCYAAPKLSETMQAYSENRSAYESLREQVKTDETNETDKTDETGFAPMGRSGDAGAENIVAQAPSAPKLGIDFAALAQINGDAVAWLYCPDTAIDYPVMKASDYSYYRSHLPSGEKNSGGALFIDYNCAPDFSDRLTIIYGHHMKSGTMFGSLLEYKKQAYYEAHPFMYLYTKQKDYRIELLYGCVIDAKKWSEGGFMYAENADALMDFAKNGTTFASGAKYSESDKIIVLSTCSYEFADARYIVVGVVKDS
jgi:sortase B